MGASPPASGRLTRSPTDRTGSAGRPPSHNPCTGHASMPGPAVEPTKSQPPGKGQRPQPHQDVARARGSARRCGQPTGRRSSGPSLVSAGGGEFCLHRPGPAVRELPTQARPRSPRSCRAPAHTGTPLSRARRHMLKVPPRAGMKRSWKATTRSGRSCSSIRGRLHSGFDIRQSCGRSRRGGRPAAASASVATPSAVLGALRR